MGRGRGTFYRQFSKTAAVGRYSKKKAGQYPESGIEWEAYERSQNLNKNISDNVLSRDSPRAKVELLNTGYDPGDIMELPTVTSRQKGATELRIFLLEEEKEFLKQVAAKRGITLSHLMRSLSLAWASQQDENESA